MERENRKWWEHYGTSLGGPAILIISYNTEGTTTKKAKEENIHKNVQGNSPFLKGRSPRENASPVKENGPSLSTALWSRRTGQWAQMRSHKLPEETQAVRKREADGLSFPSSYPRYPRGAVPSRFWRKITLNQEFCSQPNCPRSWWVK